ncbi:MAG TPA: glycosyltransferase family 39 protein [Nitrospiria bacterium]|nr:glycosyltransferase family 39 protein [Nitrospiria bacterium]
MIKHQIPLLLVISFIIRLYAALQTPVIAKDSIIYMQNAIYISSGEFVKGMEGYPPVYSILIAIFYRLIGNVEYAGQAVSVLAGTLALLPFYGLTKEIFGKQIALWGSIFFAFHPFLVQHGGEVISESTYIFFFVSALYMAWKALKHEDLLYFLSFGFLAVLAYLTRPEGIGLFVGFIVWLPIHFWLQRKTPTLLFFGRTLCVFLPLLFLGTLYLYQVRQITGEWRINAKRSMIVDSGLKGAINAESPPISPYNEAAPPEEKDSKEPYASKPFQGWIETKSLSGFVSRYIKTFFLLILKFTGILHQLLFSFVIYLLIKRRFFSYHLAGELFLAIFSLLYLMAMALLYVDGRHLLQLVPLFLPWAAAGCLEFSRRFESLDRSFKVRNLQLRLSSQVLLIVLTISIFLPKMLAGHRIDKLTLKDAGTWIRSQEISSPSILSSDSRVAYYAQGRHIQLADAGELVSFILESKPDFVVIVKDELTSIPADAIRSLQPLSLKEVYQARDEIGSSIVTVYVLRTT